jgi:fluoride exporter
MLDKIGILIAGGAIGTLGRYFLAEWGQSLWGSHFPYGTLLVNVTGCLLMGCVVGFAESRYHALVEMPYQLRLLLMTGILGAFTTFSSYELEALLLFRQGGWERAVLYLAGSIVLGLLALVLGIKAVRYCLENAG